MSGLPLRKLLALLLLVGVSVCNAGLVHRRAIKETPNQENESVPTAQRLDQIPVTIIQEQEQEVIVAAATASTLAPIKVPLEEISSPQPLNNEGAKIDENDKQNSQPIESAPAIAALQTSQIIAEQVESQPSTEVQSSSVALQTDAIAADSVQPQQQQQLDTSSQSQLNEDQPITSITEAATALLETGNSIKALVSAESNAEEQKPEVALSEAAAAAVAAAAPTELQDELQRQVTQPTPTQTSTPQNFVQQLIQNSPIGQFLSQFTGGQQQQPGQQLADEPVTPAPTLPGFLNPAAAITSAQQAVQNAAQSVVNTTTQAFQGLQQFATNLGTQFQNTFSTLAGQQNQLSTADSTTTRPPGPIQTIVSNFVNPGNNQVAGAEGIAVTPGQQQPQQQGPLQGILSFFQGGNRPQGASAAGSVPPKEEPVTPAGVDDKIETEQQQDTVSAVVPDQQEPDTANEVRSSAEVINEDASFEEGQGEDLIVVHDDAAQQDVQS